MMFHKKNLSYQEKDRETTLGSIEHIIKLDIFVGIDKMSCLRNKSTENINE